MRGLEIVLERVPRILRWILQGFRSLLEKLGRDGGSMRTALACHERVGNSFRKGSKDFDVDIARFF